jgi:hypothetical protein
MPRKETMALMMEVRIPPMPLMTAMMPLPMVRRRLEMQETTAPMFAVVCDVCCKVVFVCVCRVEEMLLIAALELLLLLLMMREETEQDRSHGFICKARSWAQPHPFVATHTLSQTLPLTKQGNGQPPLVDVVTGHIDRTQCR